MVTVNEYQAQPPVQSGPPAYRPYRPHRTLFVLSVACLVPTVALTLLAYAMAGFGTEGGAGSGDTEGGGFMLMGALCSAGTAFMFFVAGMSALVRTQGQQPPAPPRSM
jgi:hypothetical protein